MGQLVSGHAAIRVLKQGGIDHLFTLSGAHIFPLYDGCRSEDVRIIDVRHEQSAAFGAEGLAKLTRHPQVAAVTAGPGVTNSISALASAQSNGSPLVVLGGRAAESSWGSGTLQEVDHIPFVAPLTKLARTAKRADDVAKDVAEALVVAGSAHRGPTFVDLPMDVVFSPADEDTIPAPFERLTMRPYAAAVAAAASALAAAERPVLVAGTDVWYAGAWEELRALAEAAHLPVVANGMGRGCLPADHPLTLSRARGTAFKQADLVIVVGTPLDFRLGFGHFGAAGVIHVMDHPDLLADHVRAAAMQGHEPAEWVSAHATPEMHGYAELNRDAGVAPDLRLGVAGDLRTVLAGMADLGGTTSDERRAWAERLRDVERSKRDQETDLLTADSDPIHPARVYGALRETLDRDAVVIGDGGDFVSFGGRYIDSYQPGLWLDPGPYGCLGIGTGYAAAARLAHPDKQVVVLFGDGAAGFSLMDVDTLVRHRLPVVMVMGNNGIWALEKHPMQQMYGGWDVAADLRQSTRYDTVVEALGGAGETVSKTADLGPALDRAFASGVPYLINVLTDPAVAYPRGASSAA